MNNYNYEYMNYSNDKYNVEDNISNSNEMFYQSNIMNEDRVNYMPNMDTYKIQFLNQMPTMKQTVPKNISNSMNQFTAGSTFSDNSKILEPYNGFIRGNMFANLYDGYKQYKPQNINSFSERENLLNQWQQYNFALVDLDLYLDAHPNDRNAVKLYQDYLRNAKQILNKYESMYGPLTLDSSDMKQTNWEWIRAPWPWEEI